MDISGNISIVTGGSSGLGAATAKHLAQAGAKVAIWDINYNAAKILADEINGFAVVCDVSNPDSVNNALEQTIQMYGIPRICVNCAGVAPAERIVGKDGPMLLENFQKVININLLGTFNVLRLVSAQMISLGPITDCGERGVIINTASIAAFEGQIGQAAYSASKGGVVALTLPAARELARFGVRVMTIAPGLMATPMLLAMPSNIQESLASLTPFPNRFGQPYEYAELVLHIIHNSMLNGSVIRLDGALRMPPK